MNVRNANASRRSHSAVMALLMEESSAGNLVSVARLSIPVRTVNASKMHLSVATELLKMESNAVNPV